MIIKNSFFNKYNKVKQRKCNWELFVNKFVYKF